jgi:hypothetical protein
MAVYNPVKSLPNVPFLHISFGSGSCYANPAITRDTAEALRELAKDIDDVFAYIDRGGSDVVS